MACFMIFWMVPIHKSCENSELKDSVGKNAVITDDTKNISPAMTHFFEYS